MPQNTSQYLLANADAVITRSKSHNCDVHSKLDGDFVWLDSQLITGTGYAKREKSFQFLLTTISADLGIYHQTDAWEKGERCFSPLDALVVKKITSQMDFSSLFSSALSFPLSILLMSDI